MVRMRTLRSLVLIRQIVALQTAQEVERLLYVLLAVSVLRLGGGILLRVVGIDGSLAGLDFSLFLWLAGRGGRR